MNSAFRLDFSECERLLRQRLAEPAPGRVQLLCGPRQVGKTTLLLRLQADFGDRAIYATGDGPEAAVPGFWERLWVRAVEATERGRTILVLLDEAPAIADWAARLKGEWDRIRRRKLPIHVVLTGSSALRLGAGSRESLAGRFERLTLRHWSVSALTAEFGIPMREAVDLSVRHGCYPGAIAYREDLARWTAYVRDAIVEPAIGRDILALSAVRRPALLRQVFAICASSPAQVVSLQKIQGQLQEKGALETISHYLALLEDAFLVTAVPKYAATQNRRRAAPPKLVPLSNAFPAVVDPRGIPSPERDPARYDSWVENACLAHAWNSGQSVSYWREEPLEVDAVIEGSWGSWALEVKTGAVETRDLQGLLELTRRHPKLKPLLLCDPSARSVAERLGIAVLDWREFLVSGVADASV